MRTFVMIRTSGQCTGCAVLVCGDDSSAVMIKVSSSVLAPAPGHRRLLIPRGLPRFI